jgi:hypothetical protein
MDAFAEHYGFSYDLAQLLIDEGQKLHDAVTEKSNHK